MLISIKLVFLHEDSTLWCFHYFLSVTSDYTQNNTLGHVFHRSFIYNFRIYKDCVLEVSVLAVLGQEVWLQRGEARDFKVMMELGYNISHGRYLLRNIYYMPIDMFITCEYNNIILC